MQVSLTPGASPYGTDSNLPVSVADFKTFARITTNSEDALIRSFIVAATLEGEKRAKRAFVQQTFTLWVDAQGCSMQDFTYLRSILGSDDILYLARGPIISLASIKFYDEEDNATTVDPTTYYLDKQLGRVNPKRGVSWPSDVRQLQAVEAIYDAGMVATGQGSTLDSNLVLAVKMYALHMYNHRGGECEMPPMVESIFDSYKPVALGRPYMGFDFAKKIIKSGSLPGGY